MDKKQEIIKAFEYRQAIKEFDTTKKISEEDFEFILETGRLSPSSFGWEPWKFVVVQNEELREKLKEYSWGAQRQLPTASHFVIILGRKPEHLKPEAEYLKYISRQVNHFPQEVEELKIGFFDKFQQNDFDLTDDRKLFDWICKQTYIPFANMMTSAAQLGIDSCPIEGFDREKVEEILINENVLNNNDYKISAMVAFGYKKEDLAYPKTRREIEEVVQWIK